MIIENIINELDSFLTKYKSLKTDNQTLQTSNQTLQTEKQTLQSSNQTLTQLKDGIKSALASKGIINNTTADTDVVNSINSYNPPSTGGATLDTDYLKKVGLLPNTFTGTPTERDLLANNFIVQDKDNPVKFYSTKRLSKVSVQLDNVDISDFILNRSTLLDENPSIDRNKYTITRSGYYVNEFKFHKSGNYNINVGDGSLSLERTINFDINSLNSLDDYLVYAVNLKSMRNLCYDSNRVETLGKLDSSKLDSVASSYFRNVENNLNAMGSASEKLGYVYNVRTGKVHLVDVRWDTNAFSKINEKFRKSLTTIVYDNKVYVLTDRYAFVLLVSNSDESKFIKEIDYKDEDTLVFAFYRKRNNPLAHNHLVESVASYFKTRATSLSSEEA